MSQSAYSGVDGTMRPSDLARFGAQMYRWHVLDTINFTNSLIVDFEMRIDDAIDLPDGPGAESCLIVLGLSD